MLIKDFEGRDWKLDTDDITIDEWRELKRKYKMTPKAFQDMIMEADPDASTFTYFVMLRHNGQPGTVLGDHLKPDIIKLNQAVAAASAAEEAEKEAEAKAELEQAAEAADPTKPPPIPGRPPLSVPGYPTATTPQHPGPNPDPSPGPGSGTATSNGSVTSTSSPSAVSAESTTRTSGG